MSPELYAKFTTGLLWFVSGACFAMFIGFMWGGWTTATTNQKMNDEAVLANQATICVAQFRTAADYKVKIKEFQAAEGYKRNEFVEKGGYDKMPGQETASWGVAGACVAGLEAMIKKAGA
jgi:hypothetical protein